MRIAAVAHIHPLRIRDTRNARNHIYNLSSGHSGMSIICVNRTDTSFYHCKFLQNHLHGTFMPGLSAIGGHQAQTECSADRRNNRHPNKTIRYDGERPKFLGIGRQFRLNDS